MSEFSGLWKHKNNPAVTLLENGKRCYIKKKSDQYEEEKNCFKTWDPVLWMTLSAFMGDTSVKIMERENAKQHSRPNNCCKLSHAWPSVAAPMLEDRAGAKRCECLRAYSASFTPCLNCRQVLGHGGIHTCL